MIVDGKRILRVFPVRTRWTPDDDYAVIGEPGLFRPHVDEVHISCTFTWHLSECERLRRAWAMYHPNVVAGGPAYDDQGGEFSPGFYIKTGYVITSRGCIRKCRFCAVRKREGALRVLPIRNGYNVADNNLLACPREHVESVFSMLHRHRRRPEFSGGLDARLLECWHAESLKEIRTQILYLAYDTPAGRAPAQRAITLLRDAGIKVGVIRCYVLCGYDGDTVEGAEERCVWLLRQGCIPFAMYMQSIAVRVRVRPPPEWVAFLQLWINARIMFARAKRVYGITTRILESTT